MASQQFNMWRWLWTTRAPQQFLTYNGKVRRRDQDSHVYIWIACQLEVGTPIITSAVEVRFQIRDYFWIPQPRLHGTTNFFCKTKKKVLVWPLFAFFNCLLAFLNWHQFLSSGLSSNWCFSKSDTHYERKSSSLNTTFKKTKNTMFRNKRSLVHASLILSNARRSAWLP